MLWLISLKLILRLKAFPHNLKITFDTIKIYVLTLYGLKLKLKISYLELFYIIN